MRLEKSRIIPRRINHGSFNYHNFGKSTRDQNCIPQLAKIKQERINASYEAVESGNFEREIVLKEAAAIDDFTPAF